MLKKVSKLAEMEIPLFGLGTKGLIGQPCRRVLNTGLNEGVKLIDTNPIFKNQFMLVEVFKSFKRDQVFLVNKVPAVSLGRLASVEAVEKELRLINTEYFDLVLIESPGIQGLAGKNRHHKRARLETWEALMKLKEKGKIKHIGVANYTQRHIDEIWDKFNVLPQANMHEFHPFCYDEERFRYHMEKKIQVIASCPLARVNKDLYADAVLIELKKKYKASRVQVLLQWGMQKGVTVIPKTENVKHLKENLRMKFEISLEDMIRIDGLAKNKRLDWVTDSIK